MNTIENKIFLIVPYTRTYTQRFPLGVMYISSYLTANSKYNVILDYKGVSSFEAKALIEAALLKEKPKYIGITCLGSEMEAVRHISDFAKQHIPDCVLVIGGPHTSSSPQHFIDAQIKFDYLVVGEGEITFLELIKALESKATISKIRGLAYRNNGKLYFNEARELIPDLDILPLPAYEKVDMKYYCRPNVWAIRPIYLSAVNLFTSRGCPYNCKFCVEYTVFGRQVRYMSPEKVLEHIKYLITNYNIDALYFIDEAFTLSKQRVFKIFELLKKNKVHILFGCQTRVNLLDEEMLSYLKKNGCLQIDMGIESGSNKMLEVMNKNITVEKIMEIGKICNKVGIRQLANMIINIPGESLGDINSSVRLVKEIKYNVVLWNVFIPYPGVSMGRLLELNELSIMQNYPSDESIDLLERKYKFGNYKESIQNLLRRLYTITFHPKHVKLSFSPFYYQSFFRLFSFLFDSRYILALLKSKRKMQYIKNLFNQNMTT